MSSSSSHSTNLLEIIRRANANYSRIAATIRLSIHPTHHARKRASALKLTVSIQKALKLDSKQISTIPLPVIDRFISPKVGCDGSNPILKCTIPSPSTLLSPASAYSCVPLTPKKTSQDQCLTSRWSISPIEADLDLAQELPEGIAVTCHPDYVQNILCSPTDAGESVRFMVKPPQPNPFPPCHSTNHLDIPPPDFTSPLATVSDISSLRSQGSGSASTISCRRPVTPHNTVGAEKLTIRVKRKSSEMCGDTLEKRPKYDRKEWTISHRRIVQRTIPLRPGRF